MFFLNGLKIEVSEVTQLVHQISLPKALNAEAEFGPVVEPSDNATEKEQQ